MLTFLFLLFCAAFLAAARLFITAPRGALPLLAAQVRSLQHRTLHCMFSMTFIAVCRAEGNHSTLFSFLLPLPPAERSLAARHTVLVLRRAATPFVCLRTGIWHRSGLATCLTASRSSFSAPVRAYRGIPPAQRRSCGASIRCRRGSAGSARRTPCPHRAACRTVPRTSESDTRR